jgi:hypothetical protein
MDKTAAPQQLQLRDIHMPDAPSIWPLAPGWWVLIVLILLATYFLYKYWKKQHKKKILIALMQQQLTAIHDEFRSNKDKHILAVAVSDLLKRFVRFVLKDSTATSLTGQQWIGYLNSKSNTDVFNKFEVPLTQAQYIQSPEFDVPSLIATVKNFFTVAINHKEQS